MKKIFLLSFVIFCLISISSLAEPMRNLYYVDVIKNYDADTITVKILLLPQQYVETHVRVLGVDTPELRGKCEREKRLGYEAKDFVFNLLSAANEVYITNIQLDKYGGRLVADMFVDGERLTDILIREGFGVAYDGGTKTFDWCKEP